VDVQYFFCIFSAALAIDRQMLDFKRRVGDVMAQLLQPVVLLGFADGDVMQAKPGAPDQAAML